MCDSDLLRVVVLSELDVLRVHVLFHSGVLRVLVGTKCDLDAEITDEMLEDFRQIYSCDLVCRVSAKTGMLLCFNEHFPMG